MKFCIWGPIKRSGALWENKQNLKKATYITLKDISAHCGFLCSKEKELESILHIKTNKNRELLMLHWVLRMESLVCLLLLEINWAKPVYWSLFLFCKIFFFLKDCLVPSDPFHKWFLPIILKGVVTPW